MRILVIRHGESEGDILDVHEGRADFELTEKGNIQAQKMGKWVSEKYKIDKIYCSPLKRAYKTAEYLSASCGVPLIVEDKLMEFNNGLLAGLGWEEADEKYPRIENLPIHQAVYEQESKLEFRYRAEYVLSKVISENNENSTVAIVSHGGMINQLYNSFIDAPINSSIIYHTGDTGVHEWIIKDGHRHILFSNSSLHLCDIDSE